MPDQGWGRHRGGPWRGGRPPWWPEGEAWPPEGREGWRRMRGRFLWRVGAFVLAFLLLLSLLAAAAIWLVSTLLGTQSPTILLGILLVLAFAAVARGVVGGVRGSAGAAADLIEAAGRVEEGDYRARVTERGPREVRAFARAFNAMSARLEADEEERRRLLADVSHELRTPLSVIRGNLEGMLDGLYPADAAHLDVILEETHHLERLVDDLRTLSLAESGVLRLHREPTDLAALLHDVAAGHSAQADASGVKVEVRVPGDLPTIELDPTRIRQVVGNLLANALRFAPSGGQVTISAERDADMLVVDVADTGPGIETGMLDRIFDRFYRSPDSPGSGLGLPIARSLVIAHGGDISASSELGRGTTIRFTLPTS
ncbi:MAG TPA: HAMP domain-containing sensor histidine kinase [Candidatus Dormibacteraeota bacterium]|nr:HAMP domain-containing sensor histidine kinase [Candidatus Dormibacteraeota bacterium]